MANDAQSGHQINFVKNDHLQQNVYFYFLFGFGLVQWVEGDVEDHFVALLEAEEKDLVRFVFLEIPEF